MNAGARLLLVLTFLMMSTLCAWAGETPQPSGEVVVDGKVVSGAGIVRIDGKVYLPLARMAEACGLAVKIGEDGVITAGGRSFQASIMRVGGQAYVSRGDVKRALEASIYVDDAAGRAVVLTPRGQKQAAKRGGSEVAAPPRPVETPRPVAQSPPPPYGDPSKGGGYPSSGQGGGMSGTGGKGPGMQGGPGGPPPGPGQGPQDTGVPAGSLTLINIELDRSPTHNNFLRVRGRVRNASNAPIRNLTVTFSMWREGSPETTDAATGERVGQGGTYSDYPYPVGTLAPGEWRDFEIVTTVAKPQKLDFGARVIELDDHGAFDSFAVRRLRYGFKASATPQAGR